jgi:hypothetical protein
MSSPDGGTKKDDTPRYCGAAAHTATSGALAALDSMPHETWRSPRNVA